jgi:asparagine synthase (glutamine-hydrolysing)
LKKEFSDLLPSENVNRPKMGFGVPVGHWFRGPLKDLLREHLLSGTTLERGYFQRAQVERLVNEHLSLAADHSNKLWSLLMLEMWHREMVDPSAPRPETALSST